MTTEIPVYDNETLEERLKRLEGERQTMATNLKSAEEKNTALEQRLSQIETALVDADNGNGDENPQDRVNRLAQDPDGYIDRRLDEKLKPISDALIKDRWERQFEKAYNWLSKQEKVDVDELYGSDLEKGLTRIVKEQGLSNMNPIEGTKAAYKIYQQELREKEEREKERQTVINGNTNERVRSSRESTGPFKFTREQISSMPLAEFNSKYDQIKEAERNGQIK